MQKPNNVISAHAGIHHVRWIPAFAGMTVFLFALAVHADAPPPEKKGSFQWLQDMAASADSSSNQPATVAGVRGLEEVGAAPDTSVRDVAAIDRLDKIQIKDEELKTFITEGKLR